MNLVAAVHVEYPSGLFACTQYMYCKQTFRCTVAFTLSDSIRVRPKPGNGVLELFCIRKTARPTRPPRHEHDLANV